MEMDLEEEKNILILGKNGQVGRALSQIDWKPHIRLTCLDRQSLDINDRDQVSRTLKENRWDFVINTTAYKNVEQAEIDRQPCFKTNVESVEFTAKICESLHIPLFHYSPDYVFDGKKNSPYEEEDIVNPLNQYGATKEAGERLIRQANPFHFILRTSWIYSDRGENFLKKIWQLCQQNETFFFPCDQAGAPTSAWDVARTTQKMIMATLQEPDFDSWGTYHYTSEPVTTWFEISEKVVSFYNQKVSPSVKRQVLPITTQESKERFSGKAKRPLYSYLDCQKIKSTFQIELKDWREVLIKTLEGMDEKTF